VDKTGARARRRFCVYISSVGGESACTESLGAHHVCESPGERFVFHAAHIAVGSPNEQGLRVMLASYPPFLREWRYERGGLTAEPIDASGRDLIALGLPAYD
jgi:hypothetical protein